MGEGVGEGGGATDTFDSFDIVFWRFFKFL